jgi:hypothetical protein
MKFDGLRRVEHRAVGFGFWLRLASGANLRSFAKSKL